MLAACNQTSGSVQQVAASEPPPASYREQVIARVKKSFFDPYSVRDASISQPIPGVSFYGAMNTVCVRANAKNRFGAYTGLKETAVIFRGGKIDTTNQEYGAMACTGAVYEPFPEIEEGYRAPAPARPSRKPA
jgi:hypothetical protein